jgi:hypothetical protein
MQVNDRKGKCPEVNADASNAFYPEITDNENLHQKFLDYATVFHQWAFPGKFCGNKTIPTTKLG